MCVGERKNRGMCICEPPTKTVKELLIICVLSFKLVFVFLLSLYLFLSLSACLSGVWLPCSRFVLTVNIQMGMFVGPMLEVVLGFMQMWNVTDCSCLDQK